MKIHDLVTLLGKRILHHHSSRRKLILAINNCAKTQTAKLPKIIHDWWRAIRNLVRTLSIKNFQWKQANDITRCQYTRFTLYNRNWDLKSYIHRHVKEILIHSFYNPFLIKNIYIYSLMQNLKWIKNTTLNSSNI